MRLIDADELKQTMIDTMEALLKNPKMDRQEAHILAAFHTVGEMIDDAPTITPDMAQVLAYESGKAERKRGRWIPIVKGERGYSAGDFRCSVCGDPCKCYHLTNYCPNCGAEMRKGEEDA